MKRFLALLLASFMVCSMFTFSSSATFVISPEYTEIEDEEVPLAPQSPQTGDEFGVEGFAVVAVLCGAVAVISTKKAAECS